MTAQTVRRAAATTMAAAATLAIAGFTALGAIFEYPDVLASPTADILAAFRQHQGAVTAWFLVLVVSAALLALVGVLLGRLRGGRPGPWIAGLGIAAATVQVAGLSRWVLFVPGLAEDATVPQRAAEAHRTFELLHTWLGTVLGETVGYALTAAFTVLVAGTVTRAVTRRWMVVVGYLSAALIATGVLVPLGVPVAGLSNFAGYVLWCLWLVAMAVALWRVPSTAEPRAGRPASAVSAGA